MDFDLTNGLAVLERTPHTLRAMLAGLSPAWTDATEGGETWSPYVIVGHLIHGERTDWMGRARMILEHGESRTFEPFDRFAQFRDSEGRTLEGLLDEFATLRAQNLADLAAQNLTEADLDRRGRHPAFGVVTLRQLLSTWVAHDLDHVSQIARVLARQYTDEVGPWRAYLRVINGTSV